MTTHAMFLYWATMKSAEAWVVCTISVWPSNVHSTVPLLIQSNIGPMPSLSSAM
jgi:hypothetical protein